MMLYMVVGGALLFSIGTTFNGGFGLAVAGFVILNAGGLGASNAGKLALKPIHAWIG